MKIGELAQRTGVTTSRIRFYERRGLLSPDRDSDNGYRDYSAEDVDFLKLVLTAQNLGFSLNEIAEMAEDLRAKNHCGAQTLDRLRTKRADIAERISDMQRLHETLGDMIAGYEARASQAN